VPFDPALVSRAVAIELNMPVDDASLLSFLRSQRWAIEATVSSTHDPQAAIVGYAVTNQLELVFDTLSTSRKAANLRFNPRIALVIGGWQEGSEQTLQYEGVADFPAGADLARLKRVYFEAFPDGPSRESWPAITYVRVKPRWLRFSDYGVDPPKIVERSLSG
jgi:pyridoxamine 5'-phosphate oxidase-like protein